MTSVLSVLLENLNICMQVAALFHCEQPPRGIQCTLGMHVSFCAYCQLPASAFLCLVTADRALWTKLQASMDRGPGLVSWILDLFLVINTCQDQGTGGQSMLVASATQAGMEGPGSGSKSALTP